MLKMKHALLKTFYYTYLTKKIGQFTDLRTRK